MVRQRLVFPIGNVKEMVVKGRVNVRELDNGFGVKRNK